MLDIPASVELFTLTIYSIAALHAFVHACSFCAMLSINHASKEDILAF